MKLLIWLCLILAVWPAAQGIYHELSREVFKPPKPLREDSYFGYSITYNPEHRRLIISSPRENNNGTVYDCDIDSKNCRALNVPIKREHKNCTHDYWLGATVKSGPHFVVMCAPRYVAWNTAFAPRALGSYSKCFQLSNNTITPMMELDFYERNSANVEQSMDSFGWSIDVAVDDTIIIGGPGMYTGRAIVYKSRSDLPKVVDNTPTKVLLNFGYGVSSGTFISDALSYAVSSTYGLEGYGKVSFYQEMKNVFQKKKDLNKGTDIGVVGSMFGAVLCAAKMYSDKSDLLVGAPAYATSTYRYNVGAVYVYKGNTVKKIQSPQYMRTIVGQTDGAMFGSAIVNLGDLNGDKRDEVAIGAPFENNGRGAVYIYSGADIMSEKTEKTLTWLQKIEPEPHSGFDKSFGLSLTPLLDYDENGCNELAIGAPYSDAVVLLKCIAAITVHTTVIFPNLQNHTRWGQTDFAFQVCLEVEETRRFKNFKALVNTTVKMVHTHAQLKNGYGAFEYQTLLKNGQLKYCKEVPFVLPQDSNNETMVNYEVSTVLLESPINRKKFEPQRVILSDRSVLKLKDSVWAAQCSGTKGCVPKLDLSASFSFKYDNRKYIIGSSKTESFEISLNNTGEVAYDACVDLHIIGARVFKPPASCGKVLASDGKWLQCKPMIPLRNRGNWNSGLIVLEMIHLTNQDQNITVNATLRDHCTDAESKNVTFTVPLASDPNTIAVKGITNIGDIVGMRTEEIETQGKSLLHIYEIVNRGNTTWKGLTSRVSLQKQPFIKYGNVSVTMHFSKTTSTPGDSYIECPLTASEPRGTPLMHYTCKIDSFLPKQQDVKIVVPIFIMPGTLDYNTVKNNFTITSNVTLDDGMGSFSKRIHSTTTTIYLKEAIVSPWVIIVACFLGLIILGILAFPLYKCGILRRKEKQNLEKLRRSIRRQTMIRRATASMSQGPGASHPEDRKQILNDMKEENENGHTGVDNKAAVTTTGEEAQPKTKC